MELQLIRTLQCIPRVACTAILQSLRVLIHIAPMPMPSPNEMTEASGNTTGGTEVEAKQSEMKEKLPIKRSRGGSLGSLNMITGKNSGASANGAYSKSAMIIMICDSDLLFNPLYNSGSGGSANGPRDGSVGSQTVPVMPMTAAGVPAPPTNLNIGMDYWGAPTSASTPVHGVVAPVSRDGGRSQPWLQDDREVKRRRRKQSNRESARRSRLRKQAECDELAQRAEVLNEENASLREEINKLRSQCEELTSENTSLKDQLLSFPTLEGVAMDKDEQEPPDTNQTGVAETKADSYKDSK
ncbi:unnamed protein product [Brassica rapa]|uniref:BZIP domain-containing protein n=1 Tax=Brassica campestris TaxID=3711 RepID=A0A3P6CK53_BRACM|nr:unnamed protein product [Brassica rapa]VDD14900.1 unnamed protein product [Brassica rapa]